jgi:hypothetical protein
LFRFATPKGFPLKPKSGSTIQIKKNKKKSQVGRKCSHKNKYSFLKLKDETARLHDSTKKIKIRHEIAINKFADKHS